MREEDQAGRHAQGERGHVGGPSGHRASSTRALRQRLAAADQLLAPLVLFVSVYVATLLLLTWLRLPAGQWGTLFCVTAATVAAVAFAERGRWTLGLFVPPRLAAGELLLGGFLGAAVVAAAAIAVVATSGQRHAAGAGFPWAEVLVVYLPAVLHEELLFRGYPFQKIHQRSRTAAVGGVALVFALLHTGNTAVTVLGLTNIFLGGVLLGLARERFDRLWFPIGIHFAWNIASGPVLGHEVSGWTAAKSLLVEQGGGPGWITGGTFGIEGSVWMTVFTLGAIALVARMGREPAVPNAR